MKVIIQTVIFIIAITLALTIIFDHLPNERFPDEPSFEPKPAPSKRISRFLQQKGSRNPNAADHCNKDREACNNYLVEGRNTTCCNNKCLDLAYDNNNCNACKKKCDATEVCCGGECVNMAFDKRHCGYCNNKCMEHGYCIYGICDYA